ncbi:hypothetical protein M9H77_31652 [Catharanthus roseus]|uniref:Uncharacterized protein n=1 Tax=Catharanthus roseus TaxID=4058 RepID=A0ACC0A1Q6_CATRO|nr:hypothetical protein M9H77_31652 [Catharanthus roseus]
MHGPLHRCSRKAFAIIREENAMKEKLKEIPPKEQTITIMNRIFREIMGLGRHGYNEIRSYSFTSVWKSKYV